MNTWLTLTESSSPFDSFGTNWQHLWYGFDTKHWKHKHIHVIWWGWEESPQSPKSPAEGHISQCSADMSLLSRNIPLLHKYNHLLLLPHTPSSSPSSLILASIRLSLCRSSLRQSSVHPPNTACCGETQNTARTLKTEDFKSKYSILHIFIISSHFSHTWMGSYCYDTPLIDIWPVNLDFFIGAVSSVSIVTSGHIDFISNYTGSGISYTFKRNKGYTYHLISHSHI